jgi:hypothetical protein
VSHVASSLPDGCCLFPNLVSVYMRELYNKNCLRKVNRKQSIYIHHVVMLDFVLV